MFTLYRLLISEADPDAGQCGNRRWSESEFNARGNIKVRFLPCTFLRLNSGSKDPIMVLLIIPPAKRSFRGVYCFQSVRNSVIP